MDFLWSFIIIISIICSFLNQNIEGATNCVFSSISDAVSLCITLAGIICFWSGIMQIISDSGLADVIGKLLRPITKFLFPKLKKDSKSLKYIVMNITANLLGLGNAATPLGILAVKELDKENNCSDTASDEMCMFVIINTASLQIVPTTLIGMRAAAGSVNPTDIIFPIWITSICALCCGCMLASILQKRGN